MAMKATITTFLRVLIFLSGVLVLLVVLFVQDYYGLEAARVLRHQLVDGGGYTKSRKSQEELRPEQQQGAEGEEGRWWRRRRREEESRGPPRRVTIGSSAPTCSFNECRGCRFKCRAEQVPVDANDPINSAYHYRCVCHRY